MDSAAWVFAYISRTFLNLVSCFETISFAYQRNANVIVLFAISLGLFNLKRVHFFTTISKYHLINIKNSDSCIYNGIISFCKYKNTCM